ncbi:TPA: antirestriction protein [Escherichia coli]
MVLNGDVVSTGDIVNAGEIRFDNQTTQDAVLSRAVAKGASPVTFHKLTTSNLTGQGGTINMRVRLDGSNASDQLVINGGQATGKTWLAFTNVGNSNLGVATSGQGNRAEMSPEAAGIAACLMTYSHHACRTECYAMTVHYYRLRDYALQHPECNAIMRIID